MDAQAGDGLSLGPGAIKKSKLRSRLRFMIGLFFSAAVLVGNIACALASQDIDSGKIYKILYQATLDPETGLAHVSMTLDQPRQLVRSIEFSMPHERYLNIRASSSSIETQGDRVTWQPHKKGGVLQFDFVIDHRRSNGDADARITDTWALLKLDHLFPRATTRVVKGSTSQATLALAAPKGWGIETPYGWGAGKKFDISDPQRLFDKPLGWLLAGDLAVRRDKQDGRYISVASPMGSQLHANDVLAFVRWTLPVLVDLFPDFPQRLLIVSGSRDMWRGGLSGVGSLYLHSDRPLISGNRTSAILHELFHVASRMHDKAGADWIVEGLAEYYSLTLLLRSGGISEYRYNSAFDELANWSEETPCIATDRSRAQQTARAALVMRSLDAEIRAATHDRANLDTLVQMLVEIKEPVTNSSFREGAKKLIEGPVTSLAACP